MSNAELTPLFPSATHPAIPIASRILSTLRTLTAPGKGNDIKPEERAALVGVAAVLGCEKIQSHDLPASSAQKASSVSPAHFKSALLRARRLLSQVEDTPTPSKRSSPRKPTAEEGGGGGGPSIDPLSPFTTPRKKYKYSSGIDVSDLLKSGSTSTSTQTHQHAHVPATGSPLKHSHSTSRKEDREMDVSRTPTKRRFDIHTQGVDLATVNVEDGDGRSRRRKDDTSAFMALRPDPNTPRSAAVPKEVTDEMPEEEKEYLLSVRERRRKRPSGHRVELKRKDWTFRESIWAPGDTKALDKVLAELPSYLQAEGLPPLRGAKSASLAELLSQ